MISILTSLLFSFAVAHASDSGISVPTVDDDKVEVGVFFFSSADSLLLASYTPVDTASVQALLNRTKLEWIAAGYANTTLDTSFYAGDSLCLFYTRGMPYCWTSLLIDSLSSFPFQREVLSMLSIKNNLYDPADVLMMIDRVLHFYENNAYPFAVLQFTNIEADSGQIRATLHIQSHPRFVFDSLIVRGDTIFHYDFLKQYLGLHPGAGFSQYAIDQSSTYLAQLGYVRSVANPQPYFKSDSSADVYFFLEKQRANTLDGVLGITQNQEERFLLTGEANMHLQNVFRRGEAFRMSWMKHEEYSQFLDAGFVKPYLRGTKLGLDVALQLDKMDTLYLKTDWQAGLRFYSVGENYIRLFYERSMSSVIGRFTSDDELLYIPFTLDKVGIGGHYNHLDDRWNPYRGIGVELSVSYGEKVYEDALSYPHYQGYSRVSTYVPLSRKTTLALKNLTQIQHVEGDGEKKHYFDNELFTWGGLRSLRGVDDRSLQANAYSVFTAEFRYLMDRYSVFYAFVDWAYYEKHSASGIVTDTPLGFGLGADIQAGNGLLRMNYALASQMGNPVVWRSGKVHIGYISRF